MNVNFDIVNALKQCSDMTELALSSCYENGDPLLSVIFQAQKYSLLGGGKRIRPYLVLSFCRIMGGNEQGALPLACAIEMIHTYSLIHDDLPCMDNDDYRRGKLTNHKVYGEATAVLAGDALLTRAFEVIATASSLTPEQRLRSVALLSRAAGDMGMIGGQVLDMNAQSSSVQGVEYLLKMHRLKTGALIRAAVALGCIAAGIDENDEAYAAAEVYADRIGLAFQVVDDLLDVIGNAELLGKNVGVDRAANKLTFMNFYTVEEAKAHASQLTEQAIKAVSPYDTNGELAALAQYLLLRTH